MTPRPLHTLTEQEAQLVAQLKKDVAPVVEQHDHLKVFCNEHTYVRYLRARQWNLQKASKMLHTTLEWRLTYKPHEIQWDEVKHESDTGKQYVYHVTDKEGRPIVLMRPRAENTKTHESQVRFLILNLEIASKMADDLGVGKMTWLLDFGGYSMSNAPPLKVSLNCNHILQHHYPERLGCAVCYHAPMLFTMTWKAVAPFIDPVTKAKIHFVEKNAKEKADMEGRFYMEEMEKCIGGGKDDYVWDQARYTAKVNEYCAERAAAFAAAAKPHKAGDADVLLKGASSVPAKEGLEVAAAPEGSAVAVAAS